MTTHNTTLETCPHCHTVQWAVNDGNDDCERCGGALGGSCLSPSCAYCSAIREREAAHHKTDEERFIEYYRHRRYWRGEPVDRSDIGHEHRDKYGELDDTYHGPGSPRCPEYGKVRDYWRKKRGALS